MPRLPDTNMSYAAEEHVIYQLANAAIREYPYPHIYVEDIFPVDFYAALRANWPRAADLVSIESTGRVPKGTYLERFVMPLTAEQIERLPDATRGFWTEFAAWFLKNRFLSAVLSKFESHINTRFGAHPGSVTFAPEVLVVRDHTNYKIGPHTDAPQRLLSLLFYCPDDDALKHLGTSLYTPVDAEFCCGGGPHYPHEHFKKVATMDYRPNTLFAFFKTDNSFHGVEPIHDAEVLRDLMLYDIRVIGAAAQPGSRKQPRSASIGATMLRRILRLEK